MQAESSRSMRRLFQPTLLLAVSIALLLSPAFAVPALAQSTEEKTLTTDYFTIIYPTGEEASAQWYAGFADEVNASVCEMLGNDPLTGLTLHIYATEADYIAANPIAADHAGIMAHAIPGKLEIGVAVERLRQVEPEIARESFRHEMTHIIAGDLSGQNLPIGFQEGFAQYDELSISRAQGSAQVLRNARDTGLPFLSWYDLNDRYSFSQNPDLAYPQAYSAMAFIAERYGMGEFAMFLGQLKDGNDWTDALQSVYGLSVRRIDREWRNWLPAFLEEGWKTNLLSYYDLSPGVALYEAGHFDDAAAHFTRSEELYTQLGRANRAAAALEYLEKAQRAAVAALASSGARRSLESFDYRSAYENAQEAKVTFTELGLATHIESSDQTLQLAAKGMTAVEQLDSARKKAGSLDFMGGRSDARAAGQAFAELGDTTRANQATQLVSELSRYSSYVGYGVLAAGLAVLLTGAGIGLRRRIRNSASPGSAALQKGTIGKESVDWL